MKSFNKYINEQKTRQQNLNELKVYRGVVGKFNNDYSSKQSIMWVSTSKEHSQMYTSGDGELVDFELNTQRLNPLNLGFRTASTEVKFDEVKSRFTQALMKQFTDGRLGRNQAMSIDDEMDELHIAGYKEVWEWVHVPKVLNLIKKAGFNAIQQGEGLKRHSGDVTTYGILDQSLLS